MIKVNRKIELQYNFPGDDPTFRVISTKDDIVTYSKRSDKSEKGVAISFYDMWDDICRQFYSKYLYETPYDAIGFDVSELTDTEEDTLLALAREIGKFLAGPNLIRYNRDLQAWILPERFPIN